MYGAEFEGSLVVTDSLRLTGTLGYIKAEFDEFFRFYPAGAINPLTGAVVPVGGATLNIASTAVFQNTPEWTGNIGATWTTELAGGQLTVTPTASYRGDFSQFEFPSAVLDQQGYWLYDASVTWTSDTGNLKLGLHGKNLTDEEYRIGGYNFPQTAGVLFGNSVIGFYGPPRTVTATLSVKF
jgi:iron complex outermembrane receptor protein